MAIEKRTHTERVLLVFNPDGSLKAADVLQLTQVYEDGQPLGAAVYVGPFPVEAAQIAQYMPAHAHLIEQNGALLTEVGQHFAAAIEADADKAKALDAAAVLARQLAELGVAPAAAPPAGG